MHIMPFLVPITALCIPIVAIITHYKYKKAQLMQNRAAYTGGEKILKLEERVAYLEHTLQDMSDSITKIEDKTSFLERFLEKP